MIVIRAKMCLCVYMWLDRLTSAEWEWERGKTGYNNYETVMLPPNQSFPLVLIKKSLYKLRTLSTQTSFIKFISFLSSSKNDEDATEMVR